MLESRLWEMFLSMCDRIQCKYGVEKITFFLIQMDVRSSSPEYRLIISVLQDRDGEIRSMTGSI